MKAQIIKVFQQTLMEWRVEGGKMVPWVFIPEKNVAFRFSENRLMVEEITKDRLFNSLPLDTTSPDRETVLVADIEVPNELVEKVESFIQAKQKVKDEVSLFWNQHRQLEG